VKSGWEKAAGDEGGEEVGTVAESEKEGVMSSLYQALAFEESKLRKAAQAVIAEIADIAWPERLPSLMPTLVNMLSNEASMVVHSSLSCLVLVAENFGAEDVERVASQLFPPLLSLFANEQVEIVVRKQALSVFTTCLVALASAGGEKMKGLMQAFQPVLDEWVGRAVAAMQHTAHEGGRSLRGIQIEAVKMLSSLASPFSKYFLEKSDAIMQAMWSLLSNASAEYERMHVRRSTEDEPVSDEEDEAGEDISLNTLLSEFSSLVMQMAEKTRLKKKVKIMMPSLAKLLLVFAQYAVSEMSLWEDDPAEFAAMEEEESFRSNARNVAVDILVLLQETVGGTIVMESVLAAAEERLATAEKCKAEGDPYWWKMREAVMYCIGSLSAELMDVAQNGAEKKKKKGGADRPATSFWPFHPLTYLTHIVMPYLSNEGTNPVLQHRSLWSMHMFSFVLDKPTAEHVFTAAVSCLNQNYHLSLRMNACKAVQGTMKHLDGQQITSSFAYLFGYLAMLCGEAGSDLMHICIDCIEMAIKKDEGRAASQHVQPISSMMVLLIQKQAADPVIPASCIACLKALAEQPSCREGVYAHALPAAAEALARYTSLDSTVLEKVTMLVEGIVHSDDGALPVQVWSAVFPSLITVLLSVDDDAVIQQGTATLKAFVRYGHTQLEQEMDGVGTPLTSLLSVLSRILSPTLSDSAELEAGGLLHLLIRYCGEALSPVMPDIVKAALSRIATSSHIVLNTDLITLLCRLTLLHPSAMMTLLSSTPSPAPDSHEEVATVFFVRRVLSSYADIHSRFGTKVVASALCLLLRDYANELSTVAVKGKQVSADNAGELRTRSTAKDRKVEYEVIPATAKVLELLAMTYKEEVERREKKDGDDEWDTDEGEDVDSDEEEGEEEGVGKKSPFAPASDFFGLLEELKYAEDGDIDIEDDDVKDDPINDVNVEADIVQTVKKYAAEHGDALASSQASLTSAAVNTIQQILEVQ